MQKSLYLLCPTDCLETIINDTFLKENYFYTSLGNSFNADDETLSNLKCMIQKNNIRKIYFVLADDNRIVKDALCNKGFSDVSGLQDFYDDISKQEQQSLMIAKKDNRQFTVLSYFLNKKIQDLQLKLAATGNFNIEVKAKIYNRNTNTFKSAYPNLVCLKIPQLN